MKLTIELRLALDSQQSCLRIPSANGIGINVVFKSLLCVPNFLFICPVHLLMKLVPNDKTHSPYFYNEETLPISYTSSPHFVLWRKPSLGVGLAEWRNHPVPVTCEAQTQGAQAGPSWGSLLRWGMSHCPWFPGAERLPWAGVVCWVKILMSKQRK